MNKLEMYIEAVAHWDDIWRAFKDDNVEKISHLVDIIFLKVGEEIQFGRTGCVYCSKFRKIFYNDGCGGCPLSIAAGDEEGCRGTPYTAFCNSPSNKTALAEREFIRKNPPAGVKIMRITEIREQRRNK